VVEKGDYFVHRGSVIIPGLHHNTESHPGYTIELKLGERKEYCDCEELCERERKAGHGAGTPAGWINRAHPG